MSLLAALVVAGCAKETSVSSGVSAKNYFDAWIQVHYPELEPTPLGAYVIEEKEGSGDLVGDYEQSPYILANYVVSLLDGEISSTTYESVAKQLGTYDETDYYGPVVWDRSANALYAGRGFVRHRPIWLPYPGLPLPGWSNLWELRLD